MGPARHVPVFVLALRFCHSRPCASDDHPGVLRVRSSFLFPWLICLLFKCACVWNHTVFVFLRLILLSVVHSISSVLCERQDCPRRPSDISLGVCTTSALRVHLSVDGLGSFRHLAVVDMLLCTSGCMCPFGLGLLYTVDEDPVV